MKIRIKKELGNRSKSKRLKKQLCIYSRRGRRLVRTNGSSTCVRGIDDNDLRSGLKANEIFEQGQLENSKASARYLRVKLAVTARPPRKIGLQNGTGSAEGSALKRAPPLNSQ